MKKIKVLRIIARLNVGGPAIHVAVLSAGLDQSRFETVLACGRVGSDEADMSDYARSLSVCPVYVPGLGRELSAAGDLRAFFHICRLIRRERPDIVHTHTAKAGALGRAAAILHNLFCGRDRRIKLVHTFHGHIFSGYFNPIVSNFFLAVEKLLARWTSLIVTVSDSVKNELVNRGVCPASKIRVIPLGFDLSGFLNIAPPQGRPVSVGIVGRLEPVKNHRLFLEAAARLASIDPLLNFKIIGGGSLERELRAQAVELGINDRIRFLGWQRDLAAVYSALDIVVLTSVNEGTPVSLIEAMASARPVVATAAGGVPDLLGGEGAGGAGFCVVQRGIIVRNGDTEALAAGLRHLIGDEKLRQRFSLEGREFAKNNFGRERLVRDVEELYRDVMPNI